MKPIDRRRIAGAVLLALAGLSCHGDSTRPDESWKTVFQVDDIPAVPGSEWVYSVGIYDDAPDAYQRRLVATDILRMTTQEADSSAEFGAGTAWVLATSASQDTVFSYRRGDRVTILVPSMRDTIPVTFPFEFMDDIFGKTFELSADGQIGPGDWLWVVYRHHADPPVWYSFTLQKGLGIDYISRYTPYGDPLTIEYTLEDYAIGGGPHHSRWPTE